MYNPLGEIVEYSALHPKVREAAGVKGTDKRVENFLKEIHKRIKTNNLAMGGGECWFILMGSKGEDPCSTCEVLSTEECGGGIQLINKALLEAGHDCPARVFCKVDDKDPIRGVPDCDVMDMNWNVIEPALRSYVTKRLKDKKYSALHPAVVKGLEDSQWLDITSTVFDTITSTDEWNGVQFMDVGSFDWNEDAAPGYPRTAGWELVIMYCTHHQEIKNITRFFLVLKGWSPDRGDYYRFSPPYTDMQSVGRAIDSLLYNTR